MGAVLPEIESRFEPGIDKRIPREVRALVDQEPHAAGDGPSLQSTAAEVVGSRLREQVAELRYQDPLVRRDIPDSVHKMRVATRRLRSALATFRPMLNHQRTEPLRDELKWIAGVLGAARDAEIRHERLASLIADEPYELVMGPVTRRVDHDLGVAYRHAHDDSIEAMQSARYFTLLDNLETLASNPPWTPLADEQATDVLPARVARDFKRVRQRVAAAETASDRMVMDERLHEVRKAAKRARYAAEPLIPLYGPDAARFTQAIERVQTVLGEYHDVVLTQPLLRRLATEAHRDGDNTFTYGRLDARLQASAADLRAEYARAWSDAGRKKRRRWLRDGSGS